MNKKKLITVIASLMMISIIGGCTANTGVAETSTARPVDATPTPIPYEQPTSYYYIYPGVGDVVFNTTSIQNLGGQDMPLYNNGDEISVSFATDVISTDLMFEVEPAPFNPDDEILNPIEEPIVVTCEDGRYTASFTDPNTCFLGYYMRFYDAETDITYFDAIVACGDASIIMNE